jgi:tetratricopeptide (TPR) repeat protein
MEPPASPPAAPSWPWWTVPLCALLIIGAAVAAYANCYAGVFLFDDMGTLVEKRVDWVHGSRHLVNYTFAANWSSPLGDWLGATFGPAWSGGANTAQWHLFNLIVHIGSGLAAFGVVHRTLRAPRIAVHVGAAALPLALASALLFTVHPLQTEAVTYIYQRAQAAMGLFTLLSMYCAIRAAENPRNPAQDPSFLRSLPWWLAACVAWLCAMDSKPHTVFFPLLAVLHHRSFFSQTWARTVATTWPLVAGFALMVGLWVGLDHYDLGGAAPASTAMTDPPAPAARPASTCAPSALPSVATIIPALAPAILPNLALLIADHTSFFPLIAAAESETPSAPPAAALPATAATPATAPLSAPQAHNRFAIFAQQSLAYLRSQPQVICRYIALCFWPDHLCLDYQWVGPSGAPGFDEIACDLIIAALAIASVVGSARGAPWAFIGMWFFVNLAATSTFYPRPDLAVEHRMYLPLLAVAVTVPLTIWLALVPPDDAAATPRRLRLAGIITLAIALPMVTALGWRTHTRNLDYHSAIAMWTNIVDQCPDNARAQTNLGSAQEEQAKAAGDADLMREALAHYAKSVALNPRYPETRNSYGNALADAGQTREAIAQYEVAIQLHADYTEAYSNLGAAYLDLAERDHDEACRERGIACLRKSVELQWNLPQAHLNLGTALTRAGQYDEAVTEFKNSIICNPVYPDAHHNLGTVYLMQKHYDLALQEYQRSRDLDPSRPNYHRDLAWLDHQTGHDAEAVQEYGYAIATTQPGSPLRNQYQGEFDLLQKQLQDRSHPTGQQQ